MESSEEVLDDHCIQLLTLLAELEEKKQLLEKHMKDGFFNLAKARYAVGVNTISKLQYPKVMSPSLTVEYDESIDEKKFCIHHSNSTDFVKQDSLDRDNLRKRHTQKTTDRNDDTAKNYEEKTEESSIKEKTKVDLNDPIRWFCVLAPQSLRFAQKSFSQAIQSSCNISSLQVQLVEVQRKYHNRRKEVNNNHLEESS